jgi:hypothetical protein
MRYSHSRSDSEERIESIRDAPSWSADPILTTVYNGNAQAMRLCRSPAVSIGSAAFIFAHDRGDRTRQMVATVATVAQGMRVMCPAAGPCGGVCATTPARCADGQRREVVGSSSRTSARALREEPFERVGRDPPQPSKPNPFEIAAREQLQDVHPRHVKVFRDRIDGQQSFDRD